MRRRPALLIALLLLLVLGTGVGAWRLVGCAHRSPASGTTTDDDEREPRAQARDAPDEPDPVPAGPALRPDAPRQLLGKVASRDGTVVAGAFVQLRVTAGDRRTAMTDASGLFRIDRVPATAEHLEVSARGYQTAAFDQLRFPAAPVVRWNVTLEGAGGIHGVVMSRGKPVAGAMVLLFRPSGGPGHGRPRHTRSDFSGRFALELGAEDGDPPWRLMAHQPQHGRAEVPVDGPGEVTIELPGGGFVSGVVRDDRGQAIREFSVTALAPGGPREDAGAQTFAAADGSFTLGPLAPGTQRLFAAAPGYQPAAARAVEVKSGETTSGVEITLRASGTVTGRVTDARTGAPVVGAMVRAAEWTSGALSESVSATTDARGGYTLRSLPSSRTSLSVEAQGYQSLLAGGVAAGPGQTVTRDFSLTPLQAGQKAGGELIGVGAVLQGTRQGVMIRELVPGSPAEGQLRPGDVVIQIDGADVSRANLSDVAQAIRGEPDSDVVLWVRRRGQSEPERVTLRRTRVALPARRR